MKVRLTPRAESEAEREDGWWRENRPDARELFTQELADAIAQLGRRPTSGTLYRADLSNEVRRLRLAKTNNHVYFTVHAGEVVVLSVWGAPRRRGPRL